MSDDEKDPGFEQEDTAQTATAQTATAQTGTAQTGTAQTGTAVAGTALACTALAGAIEGEMSDSQLSPGAGMVGMKMSREEALQAFGVSYNWDGGPTLPMRDIAEIARGYLGLEPDLDPAAAQKARDEMVGSIEHSAIYEKLAFEDEYDPLLSKVGPISPAELREAELEARREYMTRWRSRIGLQRSKIEESLKKVNDTARNPLLLPLIAGVELLRLIGLRRMQNGFWARRRILEKMQEITGAVRQRAERDPLGQTLKVRHIPQRVVATVGIAKGQTLWMSVFDPSFRKEPVLREVVVQEVSTRTSYDHYDQAKAETLYVDRWISVSEKDGDAPEKQRTHSFSLSANPKSRQSLVVVPDAATLEDYLAISTGDEPNEFSVFSRSGAAFSIGSAVGLTSYALHSCKEVGELWLATRVRKECERMDLAVSRARAIADKIRRKAECPGGAPGGAPGGVRGRQKTDQGTSGAERL